MQEKNKAFTLDEKILIWAAIVVCLILIVPKYAWGASWYIPLRHSTTDSTRFMLYFNAAKVDSAKRTNSTAYDTSITVNGDGIYTSEFRMYYQGVDSAANYVDQRVTKRSVVTQWRTPARWPFSTDSVNLTFWIDYPANVFYKSTKTGVQSYDTTFLVSAGHYYMAFEKIWPTGDTVPVTWIWELDLTDTSSTFAAPYDSLDRCYTFGWLYNPDGTPIVGAYVQAQRVGGLAATGLFAGQNVIFSSSPVYGTTDTLGFFSMWLIRSNKYDPSGNSYYNVKGTYDGSELFNIQKLKVPSTGTLNLGDTLAARQ